MIEKKTRTSREVSALLTKHPTFSNWDKARLIWTPHEFILSFTALAAVFASWFCILHCWGFAWGYNLYNYDTSQKIITPKIVWQILYDSYFYFDYLVDPEAHVVFSQKTCCQRAGMKTQLQQQFKAEFDLLIINSIQK